MTKEKGRCSLCLPQRARGWVLALSSASDGLCRFSGHWLSSKLPCLPSFVIHWGSVDHTSLVGWLPDWFCQQGKWTTGEGEEQVGPLHSQAAPDALRLRPSALRILYQLWREGQLARALPSKVWASALPCVFSKILVQWHNFWFSSQSTLAPSCRYRVTSRFIFTTTHRPTSLHWSPSIKITSMESFSLLIWDCLRHPRQDVDPCVSCWGTERWVGSFHYKADAATGWSWLPFSSDRTIACFPFASSPLLSLIPLILRSDSLSSFGFRRPLGKLLKNSFHLI